MTQFTGYARKPEPRWFNIGLMVLVIVAIILVWSLYYAAGQWFEHLTTSAPAAPTTTLLAVKAAAQPADQVGPILAAAGSIKVERLVVASGVDENNQPVDDLVEISLAENSTVYCFSRQATATVPMAFKHVWVGPSGQVAAEINLAMSRSPSNTYSYVNLAGARKGHWEVQVRDGVGNIAGRRGFAVD
ncbi:MAG: DUF2914 domain-containing protein [Candidatus Margulisiibacteriota bacterium]